MNTSFESLVQIINARHTTKPAAMNGKRIPDEQVMALLELADRAPTHARTEPWRFWVYTGEALTRFGNDHAEMYWNNTAEDKRQEDKANNLRNMVTKVSHLVVVAMKRTPMAKIPMMEEYAAVAAATENILLGAEAGGVSVIWSTGGMAHHGAMKEYLGLGEDDLVMGLLYMGYSDQEAKPTQRAIPLEEKVKWQ